LVLFCVLRSVCCVQDQLKKVTADGSFWFLVLFCVLRSVCCVQFHPFREGNGRLARLLAMLMGLQAGLPILVFDEMEGVRLEAYLAAVRAGMGHEFGPMKEIFGRIIEQSRSEV